MIASLIAWFSDPVRWSGPGGVPARVLEHLGYSALALVIAALIAVPVGVWIGHTGKGRRVVVGLSSALRALPTLGLLTFLAIVLQIGLRQAVIPTVIVLVVLAIPPLLAGTYAGLQAVPREVVHAARANGHSTGQLIGQVELPLALPMVVGGLRSATLQVLATTSVAAYLGLGGLGRYLFDALAVQDYTTMLAGALLIAVLALAVDGLLLLLQRLLTPTGLRASRARA
ncbi:ABC transporter permease subunit [Micrococcus flavus]|uniref:Osmoprotectant transport system permease protein n=1 Tax=Micrococcus flavus TaxID=384602 RepID=A0A4Y8WXF6_9MICC|nr:ABC transporter permease subunit [Micrococcus flavus]MBB4883883.1 osmoprotectant transport system permease protein [Micrococcus flavus]TFI00100.1 ABC transporter permease subunit [Micrococcus flavus]GGK51871.1 glycine/betaine ABC transporter permease [Micrococcus flavus]